MITNVKTVKDLIAFAREFSTSPSEFLGGFETAVALRDARPDVYDELKAIVQGEVGGEPYRGDVSRELEALGVPARDNF